MWRAVHDCGQWVVQHTASCEVLKFKPRHDQTKRRDRVFKTREAAQKVADRMNNATE
jgi:hypothetical protein